MRLFLLMLIGTSACQLEGKQDTEEYQETEEHFYIDSQSRHQSVHQETRPMFDCENKAACDLVAKKRGLERHHIEGSQSRSFIVDGRPYHLVHFEFGTAQDCPSGCFFSHYCAVVENNNEFPVHFNFNSTEESLVDSKGLCSMLGSSQWCDMPAFALPLFSDETFIHWLRKPENKSNEFRWCTHQLAWGYTQGKLPKPASSSDSP